MAARECPVLSTDHPHACGENPFPPRILQPLSGPSPRVWGKPRHLIQWCFPLRTIPTRVGKTPRPTPIRLRQPDHPHACGENKHRIHVGDCFDGPSPRVWGKLNADGYGYAVKRTIPTRVGKTRVCCSRKTATPDHPHACGENKVVKVNSGATGGPSPRVWGKLKRHIIFRYLHRTIPTRVGKTATRAHALAAIADHPHACGENATAKTPTHTHGGPSPRVWGKLFHEFGKLGGVRTIPTRVGKTGSTSDVHECAADHPHACGENTELTARLSGSKWVNRVLPLPQPTVQPPAINR